MLICKNPVPDKSLPQEESCSVLTDDDCPSLCDFSESDDDQTMTILNLPMQLQLVMRENLSMENLLGNSKRF